jgi:alpha-glucosidase
MVKKLFFCAFLLFGQIFLLKGQQKTVFKTGEIAPGKVLVVHLFPAGSFNGRNPADTAWESAFNVIKLREFTRSDNAF